jgi:ketopantoate reductase
LVQSKIKDTTQLFAIGTVTGIQSKLKGKRIDVKIQNTSIIAKLNDKTYKLNELAVGQNLPHTKLNFGSDVQTEFYKKYVRWILTGCLNLLNNKGIGDSLKQTPKGDILLAITELIIFIEYEFNLKIYADDILNTMYSLPKNLKTSSYSDFQKGKPTEILNELDYVVSILKTFNNQSLMLEKWKGDIIHEK